MHLKKSQLKLLYLTSGPIPFSTMYMAAAARDSVPRNLHVRENITLVFPLDIPDSIFLKSEIK